MNGNEVYFDSYQDFEDYRESIRSEALEAGYLTQDSYVIYRNGARHTLENYATMSFRTAIANDLLDNTLNDMVTFDVELCFSSFLPDSSNLCLNWQNRIYTVEDVKSKYTWINNALWRNGGGLIHYNCRHAIEPYFEGITELDELNVNDTAVSRNYQNRQTWLRYNNQYKKYSNQAYKADLAGLDSSIYDQKARIWLKRRNSVPNPIESAFDIG